MIDFGFDNTYARDLAGMYAPSHPDGFGAPELMHYDRELAAELGLPELTDEQAAQYFSGSSVTSDATPIALAYAGHQFGGFSPQLGDGRAVLLGEVVNNAGQRWDLQLKGSGRTPFSRGGDGYAAVGPVLREQLVSFAMHQMGVPTTRVLATIRTGEDVYRQTVLDGAVLTRVASSHLRVGTFQFFAARQDDGAVEKLVHYALKRHAPEGLASESPALFLLEWVAERQAQLIAHWMNAGFVHGVMNTDNFTISGETLDYGPCAFMDTYNPGTVFSSIDHQGRYAFGNQPRIAQWNLARLGEALLPLLDSDEDQAVTQVEAVLADFAVSFSEHRANGLRRKLGLVGSEPADPSLFEDLFRFMHEQNLDHTNTFRELANSLRTGVPLSDDEAFTAWAARWHHRLADRPAVETADAMDAINPLYIPRNHIVEQVLEAAEGGDLAPFRRFMAVLSKPFTRQDDADTFASTAPADFGPYRTFCGT